MSILLSILVVLHFVGIASLLGSVIVEMKDLINKRARVLPGMFHGALTMLVTGLLMMGIVDATTGGANHVKLMVKLAVLIIVTVLVMIYRKRDAEHTPQWAIWAIGGLTLANIVIAVFWH